MEYRLGNAKTIQSIGETEEIVCPSCAEKVHFSVFSNGETKLIPQFPIVKSGKVFFLVCPKCSSVFGIDEDKGKVFSKGEKLAIGNYDLKDLKKFEI